MKQFKNMKFDVVGKPELSEIIQRMLFELGNEWSEGEKEPIHLHEDTLYVNALGITYGAGTSYTYELTTLSELAKILQEHYDSQDIVRVGDVLEVEGEGSRYVHVCQVASGEALLIGLEGNREDDKPTNIMLGMQCLKEDLEEANRCKIVKNHGPPKDLNIKQLLGESDETV